MSSGQTHFIEKDYEWICRWTDGCLDGWKLQPIERFCIQSNDSSTALLGRFVLQAGPMQCALHPNRIHSKIFSMLILRRSGSHVVVVVSWCFVDASIYTPTVMFSVGCESQLVIVMLCLCTSSLNDLALVHAWQTEMMTDSSWPGLATPCNTACLAGDMLCQSKFFSVFISSFSFVFYILFFQYFVSISTTWVASGLWLRLIIFQFDGRPMCVWLVVAIACEMVVKSFALFEGMHADF